MNNSKELNNFISLNNDVYLVQGKTNGCLYDLKNNKLYSLDHFTSEFLNKITSKEIMINDLSEEERNFIQLLIDNEILKYSNFQTIPNSLLDLKEKTEIEFVWIEITTKCNLKCIHCYNESDSQCSTQLTINEFKYVIDYLVSLGVKKIQLIGGEPFVHKDLKELLNYTLGKFQFIEVFTNGTLINKEWIDYFKENNIRIALSVYSYKPEEHDRVSTIKGSWLLTNKSIELLKSNSIKYRVCNTLMKDINLGNKNTDLYTLNPNKDVVRMSGRGSFELLTDELIKKRLITEETFSKPISKRMITRNVSGHNCFSSKLYISSDLTIYPCVMERRMNHGKIDSSKNPSLRKDLLHMTKDKINDCKDCEFRYACFDCRADSLSNDTLKKPWYCTYNPQKGKWIEAEAFIDNLNKEIAHKKQI